jgi:hypothetical protein
MAHGQRSAGRTRVTIYLLIGQAKLPRGTYVVHPCSMHWNSDHQNQTDYIFVISIIRSALECSMIWGTVMVYVLQGIHGQNSKHSKTCSA